MYSGPTELLEKEESLLIYFSHFSSSVVANPGGGEKKIQYIHSQPVQILSNVTVKWVFAGKYFTFSQVMV